MGYLDDEVKRLQGVINSLEGRVKALEGKQLGGPRKATTEEIRMLLIGPPGAGTSPHRPGSGPGGSWNIPQGRKANRWSRITQAREHRRPRSKKSLHAAIW